VGKLPIQYPAKNAKAPPAAKRVLVKGKRIEF
jgi:hypothetical protein